MKGTIYQINIKPKILKEKGIPKMPVDSAYIKYDGVDGDYNIFRTEKKKSDPNRAVMLIPIETLKELQQEGWPVKPGHLGENITTQGVSYGFFEIGQRYNMGYVQVEITEPCTPCRRLRVLPYIGDSGINDFMKTLIDRRGWYAKVLVEGGVRIGDGIEKILG